MIVSKIMAYCPNCNNDSVSIEVKKDAVYYTVCGLCDTIFRSIGEKILTAEEIKDVFNMDDVCGVTELVCAAVEISDKRIELEGD